MARDDCGRGKEMKLGTRFYISTSDHIPLRLGQECPHLAQVVMPIEQLTDRVILKHQKVISPHFVVYMWYEPCRRALP